MPENVVKLKKISELNGSSYIIPDFQRGYKWTKRQVIDLLDDMKEYMQDRNEKNPNSFYCLQPLVVECEEPNRWQVLDGQQRLTTLFLLQCYLRSQNIYTIEYQTRDDSAIYLNFFQEYDSNNTEIENLKEKNVDYFHIYNAYSYIRKWFDDNKFTDEDKIIMLSTLQDKTQFIWYECKGENVVEVFTRINIGKIGLNSAELIKAVMLNQNNWENAGAIEAEQYHIAEEWNQMEITLQNDELWYFICNKSDRYNTRIELLFDMICELNLLYPNENQRKKKSEGIKHKDIEIIGDDQYRTFRYFYIYFKGNNKKVDARVKAWNEVKKLFQVLNEWYKDVECYHYIGYLIECKPSGVNISTLYDQWRNCKNKEEYKERLKERIRNVIKSCNRQIVECVLNQVYEIGDNAPKKTVCRPILLLHNIQLVIKQNKKDEKDIFQENVFYRFPFYLLKSQNWDVEHIDSNTTNNLADNYARLLWLLQYEHEGWLSRGIKEELTNLLNDIKKHLSKTDSDAQSASKSTAEDNPQETDGELEGENENEMGEPVRTVAELLESRKNEGQVSIRAEEDNIRAKMKTFSFESDKIVNDKDVKTNRFDDLVSKIEEEYEKENKTSHNRLNRTEKNQIWNFTLLDSKTNRSYGNSIFPRKRRTIVARDQGKEYVLRFENDKFVFKLEDSDKSAFIPPVTRNVFMKYYTDNASDFSAWTLSDAAAYKEDMKAMLAEFLSDPSNK